MISIDREFHSLEEIRQYLYKYKEALYDNLASWDILLHPVEDDIITLAFRLYKKYGYPAIFKYTAEVFSYASNKLRRTHPNVLDWKRLKGISIFFQKLYLAIRGRLKTANINIKKVSRLIKELKEIDTKLEHGYESFAKYVLSRPYETFQMLRKCLEIVKFLVDLTVGIVISFLSEKINKMIFRMLREEYSLAFVVYVEDWKRYLLEEVQNGNIKLRYIHKKILDLGNRIEILSEGTESIILFLSEYFNHKSP